MKISSDLNVVAILLVTLMLTFACTGCTTVQTNPTDSKQSTTASRETVVTPPPQTAGIIQAPYYPPPECVDLCGEPVPLQLQDVRERFDREFTLIVYNHAQVYLWLKRMDRFFPFMEERLRALGLPPDLKYVAIVESDLLPNAFSPKGAAGPWQFMPATGSHYGLEQEGSKDKRFDFERATESAFRYLDDLNKRYRNWALAIAAYNCGDKRLIDEMRGQKVNDYYHLKLPTETERYVMRILAVKTILSNPAQYGYYLPKGQGYGEVAADRVTKVFPCPMTIQSVAEAAGTSYREIKRLNPVFRGEEIPAGRQQVNLPPGCAPNFERNFASVKAEGAQVSNVPEAPVAPARETVREKPAEPRQSQSTKSTKAPEKTHMVKKGDTLSSLAKHYKVAAADIKKANGMKKDDLTPGHTIRIPSGS